MNLNETLKLANSLSMWLCILPLLSLVFFQAWKFWRIGMKYKNEFSISSEDVRASMRSGIIATLGPALSIFAVGLGLMVQIGAPLTLSRLSIIGNAMYESFAAQFAASAMGTTLGAENFTYAVFTCCVFVMNLGGIAMLILPLISIRPVSYATQKATKKGGILGRVIGTSAALASFGYTSLNYFSGSKYTLLSGIDAKYTISVLVGAGSMLFFSLFGKKKNISWMREWSLAFSIILGAVSTILF